MFEVNEFNVESNELIVRTYTDEEIAEVERISSLTVDAPISIETPENELVTSAIAKLQSLGLTIDEAKAIIGI